MTLVKVGSKKGRAKRSAEEKGEDAALFHDHALWAEANAGRAEQRRAGRDRFQRALGQSVRADDPVARL